MILHFTRYMHVHNNVVSYNQFHMQVLPKLGSKLVSGFKQYLSTLYRHTDISLLLIASWHLCK